MALSCDKLYKLSGGIACQCKCQSFIDVVTLTGFVWWD